jgi:hypothetical protein
MHAGDYKARFDTQALGVPPPIGKYHRQKSAGTRTDERAKFGRTSKRLMTNLALG